MIRLPLLAALLTLPLFSHAAEPAEYYRPRLHFTAPADWINDPNGLFRVGPDWHLQFQYKWPRHWGHARSADLLHWEFLPSALAPDEVGDIWSGCTVRDPRNTSGFFAPGKGGLVSVYASWKKPAQHISLAYSADEGATWQRPPGNPVLDTKKEDFRDPKVLWHEESKRWSMIVAAGKRLELFTSRNLREWKASGIFTTPLRPDQVFECPDLFRLPVEGPKGEEKWVLISSFIEKGACETRYWIGDFDGANFQTASHEAPPLLGYGPDDYAGITWPRDPATGRTVLIAWMNTWTYAGKPPTKPWQGCMTLPRELTLRRAPGGWTLFQHPARELWTALSRKIETQKTSLIASQRQVLCQERTGALRARLQLEPGSLVEFELFANEEHKTVVGYDAARAVLYFDRHKSGGPAVHEKFPVHREASLPLPSSGTVDLQIIWDRSTVEVFAGDGAIYLSGLTFPAADAKEVAVTCRIGRVALERLDLQAEP